MTDKTKKRLLIGSTFLFATSTLFLGVKCARMSGQIKAQKDTIKRQSKEVRNATYHQSKAAQAAAKAAQAAAGKK